MDAQDWVAALQLTPHPEGGYYRQAYKSSDLIPRDGLPDRFQGDRAVSTAIYFLLVDQDFSALHRIQSDEIWHFYAGSALEIHYITPDGQSEMILLGSDVMKGQTFQAVVPAQCWFGARLQNGHGYALVGCTVAPGFEFDDFEMGVRKDLLERFPQHAAMIRSLTRPS